MVSSLPWARRMLLDRVMAPRARFARFGYPRLVRLSSAFFGIMAPRGIGVNATVTA
jgi:hypothetical protein